MKLVIRFVVLMVILAIGACITSAKRAQWNMQRGETLLEAGKYKRAVKRLEAARRAGAADPKLYYMLGSNYLYLGRYQEAAVQLEKATRADPKNADAWFRLGNAYLNMDNYEQAAAAYRRAIESRPDFVEAIEALAMLYPNGGVSRNEVLALWKRALEMEKRDEWITRAKHYIKRLENEGAK